MTDEKDFDTEVGELITKFSEGADGYSYSAITTAAIEVVLSVLDELTEEDPKDGREFAKYAHMMLIAAASVVQADAEKDAPRIQLLN